MNDKELLRKYEMRNIAQCDRIAILEAQNKQQADKIAELEKVLEQEGIGIGRDLLNGGIAIFKKPKQTKPLSGVEIIGMSGQFDFN